jgi:hypothetical protein
MWEHMNISVEGGRRRVDGGKEGGRYVKREERRRM